MDIRENLKKQYRDKKLAEIEAIATGNRDKSIENRKEFILALHYLQFTSRFRDNPAYKKQSFETYINDRFMLRKTTFNQELWAFIKYGDSAIKHGPGIISKIKRKCGNLAVQKVLKEIDNAEYKRKNPLPRSKKETIILSHALPVKEKPQQESRAAIEAKLQKAEKAIQESNKFGVEDRDQIIRLKETVKNLKAENVELRAVIEQYKAKEQKLMNIFKPSVPIGHEQMAAA